MKYSLFSLLVIFSTISFAQTTEYNSEQIKKTKVLSITIMGGPLDEFGNASPIRSKKEYRKYDTDGQLVQEIIYDKESAIVSNTTFLYTKTGEIAKYLTKNSSGATIERQACSFDEKGQKTECKGLKNEKEYNINYTYNDNGKIIHRLKKLEDGTTVYNCDASFEEDNMVLETCYDDPIIRIEYHYDSLGKLITKKTFADSTLSYTFTYSYNQKGNLIEEVQFDANNMFKERLTYNYVDDSVIKNIGRYNQNNQLAMFWKYFYDGKNNIQYIKIYEGKDKTPLYQTEYIYKYHQP